MPNKMPMCWKCASAIKTLTKGGSFVLDGCTECSDIKCFADAENLCPLFDHSAKVVIAVVDGEVSIVEKPDHVSVEVRDYVEVDDDETYPELHKDKKGDHYRVFSFPAEDIDLGSEQVIVKHPGLVNDDVVMKFHNYYRCPDCGNEWEDEWDCMVDDECGECSCSDISPYKSDDIEQEKPLESALKHITILQHNISYYLDENELLTIEVGDCEYEHIHYMITEGYIEGELSKTDPKDDENTIRGYWKIVNPAK